MQNISTPIWASTALKTYGEKMLKNGDWQRRELLAEYTINQQDGQILKDIYKRKPDVIGFSCYIWNISYVKWYWLI